MHKAALPKCMLLALALVAETAVAADAEERTYFDDSTSTGETKPAPTELPVCQYVGQLNCIIVQPVVPPWHHRNLDRRWEPRYVPQVPPDRQENENPPMGAPALGRQKK